MNQLKGKNTNDITGKEPGETSNDVNQRGDLSNLLDEWISKFVRSCVTAERARRGPSLESVVTVNCSVVITVKSTVSDGERGVGNQRQFSFEERDNCGQNEIAPLGSCYSF